MKDYHSQKGKRRKFALFIIDVQEKIIKPINNKATIINNTCNLLKAYEILEENIYLSEQNPSKLGKTINDLVPNVKFKVIEKMAFSLADEELIIELASKGIKNLIICGFETHICVQQSVLDFLKKNFEVYIISDCMSSRNLSDHNIAIQRMISKGATIASSESMIFELCQTASKEEFKEISNIIKNKKIK